VIGMQTPVPYFEAVCQRVLDAYLIRHGFVRSDMATPTVVRYVRHGVYLDVSYWIEDAPQFVPMIGIGLLQTAPGDDRLIADGIGLWYAVKMQDNQKVYPQWRFSNQRQMETALVHLRDDIIEQYARVLWENPERLQHLVQTWHSGVEDANGTEGERRQSRRAESAFEAGDYVRALRIYEEMSANLLSPIDRKRMEIARKRSSIG
jgi:hypothetical protein